MAVFTVARPHYHPAVEVENVDLAQGPHLTVSAVRGAFAEQGLKLTQVGPDANGMTFLGGGRQPWDTTDVTVTVLAPKGTLGLGHGDWEEGAFETWIGNVLVDYGGDDEATLEQVRRAVASLRPKRPARGAPFVTS